MTDTTAARQTAYADELDSIVEGIRLLLRADPFFDDIAVLVDNDKDLTAELQQSLATYTGAGGRSGAAVVIEIPDLDNSYPNASGPQWDKLAIEVSALENLLINRAEGGTYKQARPIACRVARVLHHKSAGELKKVLVATKIFKKPDDKLLIYAARIESGGIVFKK